MRSSKRYPFVSSDPTLGEASFRPYLPRTYAKIAKKLNLSNRQERQERQEFVELRKSYYHSPYFISKFLLQHQVCWILEQVSMCCRIR